jgi:hypothetical protein
MEGNNPKVIENAEGKCHIEFHPRLLTMSHRYENHPINCCLY